MSLIFTVDPNTKLNLDQFSSFGEEIR